MLRLAVEWGKVEKVLPKVEMLPGENHQDRVLTEAEEADYLKAATAIGESILESFQRALEGIRATKRHKAPIEPADPFLLRDVTTVLIDCGLRRTSASGFNGDMSATAGFLSPSGRPQMRGARFPSRLGRPLSWKCGVQRQTANGCSRRPRAAGISRNRA
jgi:hypothetical protein